MKRILSLQIIVEHISAYKYSIVLLTK